MPRLSVFRPLIVSNTRMFSSVRSATVSTNYGLHFLKETFQQILPTPSSDAKKDNLQLKKNIVLDHCMAAEKRQITNGKKLLARVDDFLSQIKPNSLEEKLTHTIDFLTSYKLRPVVTGHPTHLFSDEVASRIRAITMDYLELKKHKRGTKEAQIIEARIKENVEYVCDNSMLPETNLTAEQEIVRQNTYYIEIAQAWPNFYENFITQFVKKHATGRELEVRKALTPALKSLFNLESWMVADIDGADKRTKKSASTMLPSLQMKIIQFYQQQVALLIEHTPKLQSVQNYLKRCEAAIRDEIFFDVKSSERAKKRLIDLLDNILVSHQLDSDVASQLAALKHSVDLMGFRGEIGQYIRQSSVSNDAVLDNFTQILVDFHEEIKALLTDKEGQLRSYTMLEKHEKEQFFDYLRTDSKYFATLKQQAERLTEKTNRELDILSFVTKHKDSFSYILSDTKDTLSLRLVAVLFSFASYRNGELSIDEIRKAPMKLIPLCETSDDLARLPTIFKNMLDDPYFREDLIKYGEFIYVPGPSDLGKESGEFAHINLIKMNAVLENILKTYQQQDPRLSKVRISPLYGLGGDSQRRISESWAQNFATFQGDEAYRLARLLGAFTDYVENTAGQPSENVVRSREFGALEAHYLAESHQLDMLVTRAIEAYKRYNEDPTAQNLLRQLTHPELGPWFNTSVRGESKSSTPKDIIKSRAIGGVNYEEMTGVAIRRIMSADGLVDLPSETQAALPALYEHLTVVREVVLKIMVSIAVSDIPRAWVKLCGTTPSPNQIKQWAMAFEDESIKEKQVHHALAYLDYRSHLILQTMTLFLPEALKQQSDIYFENNPPLSRPSHLLALALLGKLGELHPDFKELKDEIQQDILPKHNQFKKMIDTYEKAAQSPPVDEVVFAMLRENVLLAFRGDSTLPGKSRKIASMHASERLFSACGLQNPMKIEHAIVNSIKSP